MMQMNFCFGVKFLFEELGYKELNWNLGCPYRWIKCGMGSGLINSTEKSTVT
jgi:tRNA-dihydrouridine synthase